MSNPVIDENKNDQAALERLNELAAKADESGLVANEPESDVRWKRFKFIVKQVNDDGTFEGYASVWGVKDSDDEVVDKGSCVRSLKNNPNFVLLWQHDTRQPVGFVVEAFEDDYGLKLKGDLMLDCEAGRYAYAFLKKAQKLKGRAGLSIGFRAITKMWVEDPKTKKSILHFTEISLMETSVVTFAANPAAFVTGVKSKFLKNSTEEQKTMSAPDFDSALEARARARELQKHHGDIENAKYDTLSAIHSGDMDDEAKKSAITDCYMKHAKAMAEWHVKSYFGESAKAFDVELHRKGQFVIESATSTASDLTTKAKASAASKASLQHVIDLHDAADKLHETARDIHKRSMEICKGMYSDDSSAQVGGGGGGTMSDKTLLEAKTAEGTDESASQEPLETKSSESTQEPVKPEPADSDSGIHSLAEELLAMTNSRMESL